MSRRIQIVVAVLSAVVLTVTIVVAYAMRAVRQVQPFYTAALEIDSNTLAEESHAMECRVAALASDVSAEPRWHTVFSDSEVNGWLAVALKEKFADLLPENIVDPRVAFKADEIVLGFRYQSKDFSTVISVRANAWISDTDVIAIHLLNAHAGTLPIPLVKVVETFNDAACKLKLSLRWTQQEGTPVALLSLPGVSSTEEQSRRLEIVELHNGELFLKGSTFKQESLLAEQPEETLVR